MKIITKEIVFDERKSQERELIAALNIGNVHGRKRPINPFPFSILEIGISKLLNWVESFARTVLLPLIESILRTFRRKR